MVLSGASTNRLHERRDTMYAGVVAVQVLPGRMDEAIQVYRDSVVPAARQQRGYRAHYLLTDHESGKCISIGLWETEADMTGDQGERRLPAAARDVEGRLCGASGPRRLRGQRRGLARTSAAHARCVGAVRGGLRDRSPRDRPGSRWHPRGQLTARSWVTSRSRRQRSAALRRAGSCSGRSRSSRPGKARGSDERWSRPAWMRCAPGEPAGVSWSEIQPSTAVSASGSEVVHHPAFLAGT